jgi:hypothetical protein
MEVLNDDGFYRHLGYRVVGQEVWFIDGHYTINQDGNTLPTRQIKVFRTDRLEDALVQANNGGSVKGVLAVKAPLFDDPSNPFVEDQYVLD